MSDWNKVQNLQGKTLRTISRGKNFTIVTVTQDRVVFIPQDGNGTPRWVSRGMIDHLIALRIDKSELSPSRIAREFPNDRNSAYLAAILTEIL